MITAVRGGIQRTSNGRYAVQIWDLFQGYEKAHGRYEVKRVNDKGKNEGRAATHREPLTPAIWDIHLAGTGPGVGVIPLRSDDTVLWGCIDIDINNIDHAELEKKIDKLSLPLVVCRSKSGGAHCFLFLLEPVEAKIVMDVLASWSASLGYGGCEIFPKQHHRFDEVNDIGNWLNMPYFYADKTNRYCVKNGEPLELRDFLEYAESKRVDGFSLSASQSLVSDSGSVSNEGLFEEGPPCLQVLHANGGFPDGTRNDGMFNVGVYLRKRFPDDWHDKLQAYNVEMCDPNLSMSDVTTIGKSVGKKDYEYRCRKPPIASHCNRRLCVGRNFGVGEGAHGTGRPEMTAVTKFVGDPNFWYVTVAGVRMQFTTDELLNQGAFKKKVLDNTNRVVRSIPQDRWDRYLDELMQTCDVQEAPEDSTMLWQFNQVLLSYLTGQARTTSREQLLTSSAPYITPEGEIWFKFQGLLKHLEKQGFKYPSSHQVAQWLKEPTIGARSFEESVKGKSLRLWSIQQPEALEGEKPPKYGQQNF